MKPSVTSLKKWNNNLTLPAIFLTGLIIYSIFYIGNALSPSSYGIFLNEIGAPSEGLVFGNPRTIRSDEWAVTTPFIQATVNNHFQRYNTTSPYKEDLRGFIALPLSDWSIPFKPTLLGFHILPPAYAFSLHYYALMVLFLIGYALLFYRCGASHAIAIGLSLLVYFSSFVQTWWTALAPPLAFFPWIYLTLIWNKPWKLKGVLLYYLSSCLLFSLFYPPLFYTLGVLAVLFLYSFHRQAITVKNGLSCGVAVIFAAATYLYYIKDNLEPLAQTVYPGQRSLDGGTVPFLQWLSQFIPSLNMVIQWDIDLSLLQAHDPSLNICEISTIGSYLGILLLIFGRWKNYLLNLPKEDIRALAILGVGFLLVSLWMLAPIPASIARFIFLDKFNALRWFFTSGMLLLGIMVIVMKRLEIEITAWRLVLFQLFNLSVIISKISYYHTVSYNDLVIILLTTSLSVLLPFWNKKYFHYTIISLALANNILIFGLFNPLQSARPIFNIPQTSFVTSLKNTEHYNQQGFFTGELFGATANGLGLPSLGHVLSVPQLSFFRCYFPELPEHEFNFTFNRYNHIHLQKDLAKPVNVQADRSNLPRERFMHITPEIQSCLSKIHTHPGAKP